MNTKNSRVMVDMSVTLLHHGHTRLLHEASKHGTVVVGLTSDKEILETKGYTPELRYEERKEILLSIRYVNEVVPAPWLINDAFLDQHDIDFLIHGDDNRNSVSANRIKILPRTQGVSSTELRARVLGALSQQMLKAIR
jgi:glycerol-3-phosphate cytidylyltransferase